MTNEEILNGQIGDTLVTGQNQELVKWTPIENTPFHIVEQDGKTFLTMGRYKVSDDLSNEEEARELVNGLNWNLLTNAISVIVSEINNIEKEYK